MAQLDYNVRSPMLPGGDLVSAVLSRQVMGLADRGGASGLVGRRWADLCTEWIVTRIGYPAQIPQGAGDPFLIERIARFDDLPRIAAAASKRGLQNPDLVIVGHRHDRSVVQAADAKFSVETARSKQVSGAVVEALLSLDAHVRSLTGELIGEIEYIPGIFLSPDYSLTHLMLRGHRGIMRATVRPSEVICVPVNPAAFFAPLPAANVMSVLSGLDRLPISPADSLLAGLYYFRLARATVGCWLDGVKPLLLYNDKVEVDESALLTEAETRACVARSAFDLVLAWDSDVEAVRARRVAVDQVTGLPVVTRDLRNAIAAVVGEDAEHAPSVNQVRRRLGSWFRGEIRAATGPVLPGEPNFQERLRELANLSAQVAKRLPQQTTLVIQELIAASAEREPDDTHNGNPDLISSDGG